MDNTAKLNQAFTTVLGLDERTEVSSLAYGETEGWDSVAHMQLVAAIEVAFEIMLDTDDVIAMSNYGVVLDLLVGHHGVEFDA